jgi:hypothetical protein
VDNVDIEQTEMTNAEKSTMDRNTKGRFSLGVMRKLSSVSTASGGFIRKLSASSTSDIEGKDVTFARDTLPREESSSQQ